jgi:uncharacterized alpha-E superfamily protein
MALRLIVQTVLLRRNPSLDKSLDSEEHWTRSDLGLAVERVKMIARTLMPNYRVMWRRLRTALDWGIIFSIQTP